MRILLAIIILTCCESVSAQVFELKAGSSSLYGSQGGMLTMHGPGFDTSLGMGMIGGRFIGGAQLLKTFGPATYTLGSTTISFNLPTDVFDSDHYVTGVGGSVSAKLGGANLYGFVGASTTSFNSPFFNGAALGQPASILKITSPPLHGVTWSAAVMLSRQITAIESFEWRPKAGLAFALSGGMGTNQPYGAVSFTVQRPWLDLKAAYITAGSSFRRTDVSVPLTSEPNRENIAVTLHPSRRFSVSASRQNYLLPVTGTNQSATNENIRSTVNQVSGTLEAGGTGFTAMLVQSTYGGGADVALAFSANRRISERMSVQTTYLRSRPQASPVTTALVTSLQETLSPRWSLTETMNTANGQSTLGCGGAFLSNVMTLSAEYQTYYVPARVDAPFQQALILNAELHILGRLTVNGGTFVAPDGRLLYTAEAEGTTSHEHDSSGSLEHNPMGTALLKGQVLNLAGDPVMGAALLIDQSPVYTDSNGYFFMRERRSRTHPLTILADQFLNGSLYRVISAPAIMRSSPDEDQLALTVIVDEIR